MWLSQSHKVTNPVGTGLKITIQASRPRRGGQEGPDRCPQNVGQRCLAPRQCNVPCPQGLPQNAPHTAKRHGSRCSQPAVDSLLPCLHVPESSRHETHRGATLLSLMT